MSARGISAVAATLALAAFAAAAVGVAAHVDPTPALAPVSNAAEEPDVVPGPVSTVTAPGEPTVESTPRDTRVVPTPDGPVEPPASTGPPEAPLVAELAQAPADAILYRLDCSTWVAADRNGGRAYAAGGLEQTCDVRWTPDGRLVAVANGTRVDRVELLGRDGVKTAAVELEGDVRGPVAAGPDGVVFCLVSGGDGGVLYALRPGDPDATPMTPGCLPAMSRSGHLAWAAGSGPSRTSVLRTVDLGPNIADGVRLADFAGEEVLALAWTGDERLLVVVVRGARRTRVLALAPGERRALLSAPRTATVRVYPSPADGRVLITSRARGGGVTVRMVDAATGLERWQQRAELAPAVAWSPYADEVLLTDRFAWTFRSAETGRVRERVGAPGDAPSWCCLLSVETDAVVEAG